MSTLAVQILYKVSKTTLTHEFVLDFAMPPSHDSVAKGLGMHFLGFCVQNNIDPQEKLQEALEVFEKMAEGMKTKSKETN